MNSDILQQQTVASYRQMLGGKNIRIFQIGDRFVMQSRTPKSSELSEKKWKTAGVISVTAGRCDCLFKAQLIENNQPRLCLHQFILVRIMGTNFMFEGKLCQTIAKRQDYKQFLQDFAKVFKDQPTEQNRWIQQQMNDAVIVFKNERLQTGQGFYYGPAPGTDLLLFNYLNIKPTYVYRPTLCKRCHQNGHKTGQQCDKYLA